jgi:hypothetical protein
MLSSCGKGLERLCWCLGLRGVQNQQQQQQQLSVDVVLQLRMCGWLYFLLMLMLLWLLLPDGTGLTACWTGLWAAVRQWSMHWSGELGNSLQQMHPMPKVQQAQLQQRDLFLYQASSHAACQSVRACLMLCSTKLVSGCSRWLRSCDCRLFKR